MIHRPWPYTARLVARMADSSLNDDPMLGSMTRPPRSGGLHASTLLRRLHQQEKNDITPAQLAIYGLVGLAFEDRAERALLSLSNEDDWPWVCLRSDEVTADGIACSPDILLIPKTDGVCRELSLKCTWKSCRGLPTTTEGINEFDLRKWGYYIHQCMTYATPLDTLGSILFVCFVCGDYSGAKQPQIHGWELDYSVEERGEVWAALQTIATEERLAA